MSDSEDSCNSLGDEHFDYYQEVARSGFADMLHDTERNQKYYLALKKAIEKMHERGAKANVLDIGTGTGLLSMMAVRCGADTVTACEAFVPMAECALKIIEDNGMAADIRLIKKRSTDICIGPGPGDMWQRANILVTEVFDTELIGEGAIQTFNHAHEHLLEKDCIVVPDAATMYAQVVESSLAWAWNTPKLIANLDGEVLLRTPLDIFKCKGSGELHDIQLNQLTSAQFFTLVQPTAVFQFDWSGKQRVPREDNTNIVVEATKNGSAQIVFVWWDLKMDQEGEILLSCAPHWAHPDYETLKEANTLNIPPQNVIPWRDHWMQAVYYLPEIIHVQNGDKLTLHSHHDEFSLWFNLTNGPHNDDGIVSRPICTCGFHLSYSRTRIGQLNDNLRNKKYTKVLENEIIADTSVVLFLSDGSLLGLAVGALKAKQVYCLEPNRYSRQLTQKYIDFNKLSNVQLIENLDEGSISDWSEITHVIGEPSFITSILPWDNFYFMKLINEVRDRLNDTVKIIPSEASIQAVPVEFLDLHKICAPFGACKTFDLSSFDQLLDKSYTLADRIVEAQPLWEYPNRALGTQRKVCRINFKTGVFEATSNPLSLEIVGNCNGIALWVDWNFCSNPERNHRISTGPTFGIQLDSYIKWDMHTRQGVCLLPRPIQRDNDSDQVDFSCAAEYIDDTVHFKFDFKQ